MVNTNELTYIFSKYNARNFIHINEKTLPTDFCLLLLFCLVFFMFLSHICVNECFTFAQ